MLKIYVNTWGNYNEHGAAGGKWIQLPDPDLDDTLEAIAERMGDTDPEWFANDYEWTCGYNLGKASEYESISKLNEIAEELAYLDDCDLEKLAAIVEEQTDYVEIAMEQLDDCTYYPGMTLEEVAEQIVDECYNLPEIALRYFDYEAFARDLRFDGYCETTHGVICIY